MGRGRKEQGGEKARGSDRSRSPARRSRSPVRRSRSPVRDIVGRGGGEVGAIDVGKRSVSVIKFTEEQLVQKDLTAFTQGGVKEARSLMQKLMDIGALLGCAESMKKSAMVAHQVAKKSHLKFVDCAHEPVAQAEMQSPLALAEKALAQAKDNLDFWTAKEEELKMSYAALKAESDAIVRAVGPQPYYGDYETSPPKSSKESHAAMKRAMKK